MITALKHVCSQHMIRVVTQLLVQVCDCSASWERITCSLDSLCLFTSAGRVENKMNAERDCYQDLKEQKRSQIITLKETRLFYVFFFLFAWLNMEPDSCETM